MPRYYGGNSALEQYGGTAFDPLTGRLNGGQLVMQVLNQIAALKEKKQQGEWDIEDRDLNKRYKEAQIGNLQEPNYTPKVEKPISQVSPVQVKTMMKRLGYPDEAITEVDTMNDVALKDTWGKLQDHFRQITSGGGKVPSKAATAKGRLQQQQLKNALDVVKARGTRYNAALSQLYANPDKATLAQDKILEYETTLDDIEKQMGEIASMMNNIDESGELTEQQFAQLNTILKFKRSYKPYRPAAPKTEAEGKLPPGFTIQK